jgi:phenylpropionate dioxygenase-like ring-hydroxylating dioxygenase large terminal subunit
MDTEPRGRQGHHQHRWAARYPELGTGPVAIEPFISPRLFELERERIFKRSWLNVGNASEIPDAGDYFVKEIAVCKVSILVIRGHDGVIRAFHNVCSHRGNILVAGDRGRCRGYLTCNFHSWGYDSAGNLRSVPDERNFFALDKSAHGLTPIAAEVWNGFIFINLDPQESLLASLGGVAERLSGGGFDQLRLARRYTIDERANWKVAIDAQNESYHVLSQHRYLMPSLFPTDDMGCLRLGEVTFYDRNSVYALDINPSFQPTPIEAAMMQLEIGSDGDRDHFRLPMRNPFEFFLIYPNSAMIFFRGPGSDACIVHSFWPIAVDRTLWEIRYYTAPPRNAGEQISQDFMQVFNRVVFDEDASAHETVQAGLESGAKKHIILQDDEVTIRHFHRIVENAIGFAENAVGFTANGTSFEKVQQ